MIFGLGATSTEKLSLSNRTSLHFPDGAIQPGDDKVYRPVQERVEDLLVDIEEPFRKKLAIRSRVKCANEKQRTTVKSDAVLDRR